MPGASITMPACISGHRRPCSVSAGLVTLQSSAQIAFIRILSMDFSVSSWFPVLGKNCTVLGSLRA